MPLRMASRASSFDPRGNRLNGDEGRRKRPPRGTPHKWRLRAYPRRDAAPEYMRVQEQIRPREAASLSRLLGLISAGERKVCLKLRDDIEDAPDPSDLRYSSIAADVSPGERIDDRYKGLFLGNDAGVGARRWTGCGTDCSQAGC